MIRLALRDWIGVALIVAFIGAVGVLFWKAIPTENEQLIVYMLGQLSGFVGGVVSFHYVMSKSSEKAIDIAHANAAGPTGKAGDPVHVQEETKP